MGIDTLRFAYQFHIIFKIKWQSTFEISAENGIWFKQENHW